MARIASIINFKGGVGKTSLSLHLACYLENQIEGNPKVLLIDVDHQSSLSIICLDPDRWEEVCSDGLTVNRIFSSYISTDPMPGAEIISESPFDDSYPNLDLLSAQLELDDTEIDLAATTIGNPLQSEWKKRTLLCKWLEDSGASDKYDFVIIDCPPATKIVSQNAIAASHFYILPVIPDAISTRGVTHFYNLVQAQIDGRLKSYANSIPSNLIPQTYVADTQFGGIVISNAQTHGPANSGYIDEHTRHMRMLRRDWEHNVYNNIIERATGVAESLGDGWPVYNRLEYPNVINRDLPTMFKRVCSEIVARLGW